MNRSGRIVFVIKLCYCTEYSIKGHPTDDAISWADLYRRAVKSRHFQASDKENLKWLYT